MLPGVANAALSLRVTIDTYHPSTYSAHIQFTTRPADGCSLLVWHVVPSTDVVYQYTY